MNNRAEAQADQILPNGHILRYTFRERLMHWINGFAYLYLMLTGLAFWSPWLLWIAVVLGGAQISRMLHPWVGLVFAFSLTWMFITWASQMHTTKEDKAWMNSMDHYVRNEDEEMPPAGRYNMGQKLLFWGFVFCGVLLLLVGAGPVGPGIYTLERSGAALSGGAHSSRRGVADHRPLHDSHLHERLRRAWRIQIHDSRRCLPGICQAPSPLVVGTRSWIRQPQIMAAKNVASDYDGRIRRAERLASLHPFTQEVLTFYKQIAEFQKSLYARMLSGRQAARSRQKSPSVAPGIENRRPPSPLSGVSASLSPKMPRLPSPNLRDNFQLNPPSLGPVFCKITGLLAAGTTGPNAAFDQFLPRAFLQPYAEHLAGDQRCGRNLRLALTLSIVWRATAVGSASPRRRRRQAIPAVFVLLAGVGISEDFLRDLRRRNGNQTAGLCRGTISLRSGRGLRDLQILFANDRSHQGRKRRAAGGRPGRYSALTVG